MNVHDEIAVTAFELFEARNCVHGCDLDDWLNAERMVLGHHAGQEMEEPEEDEGDEEQMEPVESIKAPYNETDEPMNEEMS